MNEQTMPNLDIKDFQSISAAQKLDHILMVLSNGVGAKITVDLLIKILLRDIQPSIDDSGIWHIGSTNTELLAVGKSPFLQTSENGIEWKYEGETSLRPLVSYEQLKLKFDDLSPEQFQSLKLTLSDLTPEEIAELQQPATETIESVKKVGDDVTAAETLRVETEGKRTTAETARDTKEKERLLAETNRGTAENSRVTAETTRDTKERDRLLAETNRGTAESKRATAETARKSAEENRSSAENSRITAETARVTAENKRVETFNTLKYGSETATAAATETATHPTKIGEDHYVYQWNAQTKVYDKTTIYVKGDGLDYNIMTPEEKENIKGLNAYQVALENGFVGTVEQWLASLQGTDGVIGADGVSPHIGDNGNWCIGINDTGVKAQGANGISPHVGENGNWHIGATDTGIRAQGPAGIFDTTTEFSDLTTTNKTVIGAINELDAAIFPSVITNPQMGDMLMYDGEKWRNKNLPDEGAYIPYGYEFITENNVELFKCVKKFPYPHTYTNTEGIEVTDVEYRDNKLNITYLPPINTDLKNLSYMCADLINLKEITLVAPLCVTASNLFAATQNFKKLSLFTPLIVRADSMFSNCKMLEEINCDFPNVTNANYMFYNTKISKSPKFGTGKLIECGNMFNSCSNLSDLNGIDLSNATYVGSMFRLCGKLNISTIKSIATSIDSIFSGCASLENMLIDIPNSYSASGAFYNCTALKTVTMNGTPTEISGAFYNCTALTTINANLVNSSYNINDTFRNCSSLTTIDLGLNVFRTRLSNTFKGCSSLTTIKVYLSGKLNVELPFKECIALTDIELKIENSNLTSHVFDNCSLLRTAKITFIGFHSMELLFMNKVKLIDVDVIASELNLKSAFLGCTNLINVKITSIKAGASDAFKNCSSLTNLQLSGLDSDINLSASVLLTKESLLYLFNNAVKQTSTSKKTITLGATNLAKLSAEDRLIATNKNFLLK